MPEPPSGTSLHPLIGLSPTSSRLSSFLASLSPSPLPPPQIASYPDIVYYNYHPLALSLSFEPRPPYRPNYGLTTRDALDEHHLTLVGIDVYNHEARLDDPKANQRDHKAPPEYEPFPAYPILISHSTSRSPAEPAVFPLTPTTTGAELVAVLGEPSRKGGGTTAGVGIWTEWTEDGVMVEWASGGLEAWEKGAGAVWRVLSVFERGVAKGKEEGDE
ncbi:SPOSA6832_04874 [Sporobolomyces salmonicolor]|uniref:SPOSA6832_04874-mRNA-1:cds n=1 Tax=Sporidiobolus salmonicolor TaxID=5005 RepID=A0A0D6ET94_SPOSA|nr:SPOSA6832_04874 [Sporobolomyces salmonicolor]